MPFLSGWSAVAVAAFLALTYCVKTVRDAWALWGFHGHWASGFSRLWFLKLAMSKRQDLTLTEVNDTYGSTARIAPAMLLTRDPDLVLRMNNLKSAYTRGEWYRSVRPHPSKDSILSLRDDRAHNDLRAKMVPGFSGKDNECLEDDIDGQILKFFDYIRARYMSTKDNHRTFDLSRFGYFTLDVISTVAFGKPFGYIDGDRDPFGYLQQLRTFLSALMFNGVYGEIMNLMRLPLMQRLLPSAADAAGLGKIMGIAKDTVAERFGAGKVVRRDMLGSFIAHGLTQGQLESETLIQIAAGSDTSSTALRTTVFHLASYPPAYNALMQELDAARQAGRLTRPILKDAEARELPYLQACIREGLRLSSPAHGYLAKQVPPTGDVIDGKPVPAGTQIAWNPFGVMRDRATFGADAELFRPERWLPQGGRSEAQLARMRQVQGLVFGGGRYMCLGRAIAYMELNKVIVEFFTRFTVQICNPAVPFKETVQGLTFHDDMFVRVEAREQAEAETTAA